MAAVTITEALVRSAGAGFLRDDKLRGFGLRVTANGAKSYIAEARVDGKTRRFTIAPADRITVVEARQRAKAILLQMSDGVDPQLERRAKRERTATLAEMLDDYISARRVKDSTANRYRDVLTRRASDWMDKPIADITGAMTLRRFEEIAKVAPADANNFGRVLRAVCLRAVDVLPPKSDGSPAMVSPPTRVLRGQWATVERRTSLLDPDEVAPWWSAVCGLRSEGSRRALQTLLLTGLRVNEALRLDWSDVNTAKRTLAIADSKTGAFVKVVGPWLAGELALWRQGQKHGPVFGVNDLRTALEVVAERGGKALTPHDLRRTFASFAERSGVPFTGVKRLLNHSTKADVTLGYIVPSTTDMLVWSERVEAAILAAAIRQGENVVAFPRTA